VKSEGVATKQLKRLVGSQSDPAITSLRQAKGGPSDILSRLQTSEGARVKADVRSSILRNDRAVASDAFNQANPAKKGFLGLGKTNTAEVAKNRNIHMANLHNQSGVSMGAVPASRVQNTTATLSNKAGDLFNTHVKPNARSIAVAGGAGLLAGHIMSRGGNSNNGQPRLSYAY
jgi:hypothetical protein